MAEVRVAVRATIAAVLSYALATLVHLPQPYWSVIASLLVIQATVGASLQFSLDWVIGTIGGAIYGSVVGWLIPHDDPAMAGLALALGLAPLAFLAAINGRYRIAPVTAVIALIVPRGPDVDAITFTLERTAEIGLGALIAVAVALLVLPARAHGLLAEAASRVLLALADLLPRLAAATAVGRASDAEPLAVFAEIRGKMAALDAAAEEARRERQIRLTEDPDPDQLVLAVVRVRNDAIMIFRATSVPFPAPVGERLAPRIGSIAGAASTYLRDLAAAFETRAAPPMPTNVHAALTAYAAEVDAIRADGLTRGLPTDAVERLFSLGFAFDQLSENLASLAGYCGLYARPPIKPPARADGA
ncbi:MAG TPA: FUSC family protein [Kofleriaceae bacterium]|jgi:uncharacterized membrane protein YccC